MLELFVDGQLLEVRSEPAISLVYDGRVMADLDRISEAQDVDIEVLLGLEGERLFSSEGCLHAGELFNSEVHLGAVCLQGEPIIEGELSLLSLSRESEGLRLKFRLRIASPAWAYGAEQAMMNTLNVPFEMRLGMLPIELMWVEDSPVQFFPVHRDIYEVTASSVSSETVRVEKSIDDYHPFLHIRSLVKAIIESRGYSIESRFMDGDFFKSLYMSGAYTSQYNEAARTAMDFYVTRLEDGSAEANYWGRVSMSAYDTANSVGNFIDVSSLESSEECFSRNSCVTLNGIVPQFTPITQVSVGFEFRIKYTTDYRIATRDRLRGFDTFYLYNGITVECQLANRFEDNRGLILRTNFSYRLFVFANYDELNMRLMGRVEGGQDVLQLAQLDATTTLFVCAERIEHTFLEYWNGSEWREYEEDWAIYEGYVDEYGETEVDVIFRSTPQEFSPTSSLLLENMYATGAEAGMRFTLKAGSSWAPIFAQYPGYGALIHYEDVAQQPYRQMQFLQAVQHLFNLRFYSDDKAKVVYIEPAEEICFQNKVWDWTERIVRGQSVVFEDVAADAYRWREWAFQQGDGLLTRTKSQTYEPFESLPPKPEENPQQEVEGASSAEFGAWSIETASSVARQSSQILRNPIFSASLSDTDGFVVVGDRDDTLSAEALECSPRVLSRVGVMQFENRDFPKLVFHSGEDQCSLCFEDRDGMRGLNHYYNAQIEREQRGRYLTLSLAVSPIEAAQLLYPVEGRASVLSHFGFWIEGEWAVCRLVSFEGESLAQSVLRCKFLIIE